MICNTKYNNITIVCLFLITLSGILAQDAFIQNLDSKCFECLCYAASNCDTSLRCDDGYCGPYRIGKRYWMDAGTPTIIGDNPNSDEAFVHCAFTTPCAQGTIRHYLARYATDCNKDGVTNCDDYAMINFNGAFECGRSVLRDNAGRLYWQRYKNCGNFVNK